MAVGDEGVTYSSADGVTWQRSGVPTPEMFYGVTWNGSSFIAVGTGGLRAESADGVSWLRVDAPTSNDLYSVRWTGGRLIALGRYGTILADSCGAQRGSVALPRLSQGGGVRASSGDSGGLRVERQVQPSVMAALITQH